MGSDFGAIMRVKLLAFLVPWMFSAVLAAAEVTDAQRRFFEEQVRPVLADNCYGCHGPEKQRGELRVDSLSSLLSGGDSGPAIAPGKPGESLLIEAVRYESLEMPPDGKLAQAEIDSLARWVEMGSPWPGDDGSRRRPASGAAKITDEDRAWWAFQPVRDPVPPRGDDGGWCRSDLDRFIFQKLAAEGLKPAPPAERATLIRRVTFDLIGLPPSPEEVAAFVADEAPDAYERLVDRLLDSPRYGERWARHWLDLVRYAESDGYRQDAFRPHAWRYRDYVIRAFNEDKPYDRFVLEQLAGDEIAPHDPDALAATAYLRHWIYEYNQRDARNQWDAILTDVTNVTGDVFLGLGMGCARCHDHKFDPILREDYFKLKAFFTPLLPRDDLPYATGQQWARYEEQRQMWEAKTAEIRREMAELERPLVEAAQRRAAAKFPPDVRAMLLKAPAERAPLEHQLAELANRQAQAEVAGLDFAKQLKGPAQARWLELKRQLDELASLRPAPLPPAFTVTDVGPVAPPTTIPGDRSGREIAPGYLTVLGDVPCEIVPPPSGESTGRRTALARWIARPDNPLTARVLVNRIWQQHFGTGLVETASDFGRLGQPPSHPELLDWLASRFLADGWRWKPLQRLIVTSATYRQASHSPSAELARRKDPENRWLWRMNIRRLDAEQIRDAMLATSGELDLTAGGPSVDSSQPRRSIYAKVIRNTRDPVLDAFDVADGFSSTDRRNITTTPTQSLLMINGPWPLARAKALARRLQTAGAGDHRRIEAAWRWAYGRSPTPDELPSALRFLQSRATESFGGAEPTADQPPNWSQIPGREGGAALIDSDGPAGPLRLSDNSSLPSGDFTLEAVIQLRSLYEDATVRTIVAQWDDNNAHPGWAIGVTSQKSRYQPRNLILQLVHDPKMGGTGYQVIASDLRPELNRPYFAAVSVQTGDGRDGLVTFRLRDLSDPAATMQTARVTLQGKGPYRSSRALVIGGRDGAARSRWDGWIDDVRLSRGVREEAELLLACPVADDRTIAFWRFETAAELYRDQSAQANHLTAFTAGSDGPASEVWTDFCHILLNANEFLYVD